MDLAEARRNYDVSAKRTGFNVMPDVEEVFFISISTPSAGLWSTREKIERRGDDAADGR